MAKFFETFNVIESEGAWTRSPQEGYPIDTLAAGFTSIMTDICAPANRPEPPDYQLGAMVHPVAIIGNQVMPVRCAPEDAQTQIVRMMAGATEHRISEAMWAGTPDSEGNPIGDMYLTAPGVPVVPRGADWNETLAKVLQVAFNRNPHIRPVIHLGWHAALALQFGLQNLKIPFVVPSGYPINAVAVTDEVTVHLSPIVTSKAVRRSDNRTEFEATRFAAIEFDPYTTVRAADSN